MRWKKPRKPRGIKLSGNKSYDFCPVCYAPFCDPMSQSIRIREKITRRLRDGRCPACGNQKQACRCKSGLGLKNPVLVTHNNRKQHVRSE